MKKLYSVIRPVVYQAMIGPIRLGTTEKGGYRVWWFQVLSDATIREAIWTHKHALGIRGLDEVQA